LFCLKQMERLCNTLVGRLLSETDCDTLLSGTKRVTLKQVHLPSSSKQIHPYIILIPPLEANAGFSKFHS
jgi:hypothetical protein